MGELLKQLHKFLETQKKKLLVKLFNYIISVAFHLFFSFCSSVNEGMQSITPLLKALENTRNL